MTGLIVFFVGLAVGSFANVLIDRLPKGQSVLWGRSRCDYCKKTLRSWELIPVVSYVLQRGRCRRCHKRLSYQYPLIELVTAVGFVFLYPQFAYWIIFSSLLIIFVSDLKYQIIPDSMVILGILGALGALGMKANNLASAIGASLFFLMLYLITRGRGMGLGDVKLAFLLGFLLGFPGIVVSLYGAFLTGALAGVILILRRQKKLKSKIAFGPFLILGTVVELLWGQNILAWWRGIL